MTLQSLATSLRGLVPAPLAQDAPDPTPPVARSSHEFRPDLEGLRAIAVILVLLYHAGVPGFTGGYVGVDVFFVLSGFLITGLLLRELRETGSISLQRFYARRGRRILPASALVLVVTLAVSALVVAPLALVDIAGDAAAAAMYIVNVRFAVQATDYLQSTLPPSPILHFWSLSAEEQFYLFWPALVLVAGRFAMGSRRRLAVPFVLVVAASFVLSLYLTSTQQPWAFFSLPTRAWELGAGALLALGAAELARVPSRAAAVLGWGGLALVAVAGVAIAPDTPFPGWAALLPVLGTAAVVAAGTRAGAAGALRHVTVLGWAPLRYIGRISYSLYLWHWPVLVLVPLALGTEVPLAGRIALVVLVAGPLAALSQRYLEDPLRRGKVIGTVTRKNLAFAGALSLAVALGALGVGQVTLNGLGGPTVAAAGGAGSSGGPAASGGDALAGLVPADGPTPAPTAADLSRGGGTAAHVTPSATRAPASPSAPPTPTPVPTATPLPATQDGPVPGNLTPTLASAREDRPQVYPDGCHLSEAVVESPDCVYGDPGSDTTIVLFGDSHAAQWFPALQQIATDRDWRLVSLTKSACGAVDVTVWSGTLDRAYAECDTWRQNALARIAAEHPALVIASYSRQVRPVVDGTVVGGQDGVRLIGQGLARMLGDLRPLATDVTLIGATPESADDAPVCLSAHPKSVLACATPVTEAVDPAWLATESSIAAAAGAGYIDPTPWVCPSGPCPAVIGRYLVYRDNQHLATPFAEALSTRLEGRIPLGGPTSAIPGPAVAAGRPGPTDPAAAPAEPLRRRTPVARPT